MTPKFAQFALVGILLLPALSADPAAPSSAPPEAADENTRLASANAAAISSISAVERAETTAEEKSVVEKEEKPLRLIRYRGKGLEIGHKGKTSSYAKVGIRSQLRLSSPFASAPRKESHFASEDENDFRFRRARFKVDGHLLTPWINYKFEHDLVGGRILDARMTIAKYEWLQFRFGQWKADYSRERMDSSGKQQFVERSIVNRAFTVDRQKGAMILGRLMKGKWSDSTYYVGAFAGNGRGFRRRNDLEHEDGAPMLIARYQWNFLGVDPGRSGSDLDYHHDPAAAIAVGTTTNRSRFTRFSGSGGGQMDGFELGAPGQYSLKQYLAEFHVKFRGLAIQHEYHTKRIRDNVNITTMNMRGAYVAAGYFFHHMFKRVPKQLELGTRYAFVDPNIGTGGNLQKEVSFLVNWFFDGHGNKLTLDTSRYRLGRVGDVPLKDVQVRVQWDVSF